MSKLQIKMANTKSNNRNDNLQELIAGGESISLEFKETAQNWANQISQSTEPRAIPEIELHEIEKKSVVAIRIKEYPIKPVSFKGRCYRRVENSNRIMPAQEIAEMHFHSTGISKPMATIDLKELADKKVLEKIGTTGRGTGYILVKQKG